MKYNGTNLTEVLEAHKRWLNEDEGWTEDDKADFSRADLIGANLSGADLSRANLSRANLSGANLSRAYLSEADLSGANLSGANLSGANLSGADLIGANLSGADLSRANLSGANLSRANLSGANLIEADLSRAYLIGANLSGADLSEANLSGADLSRAYLSRAYLSEADLSEADLSRANLSEADLSRAKNVPYIPVACPTDGAFIGWKKAFLMSGATAIIKLLIPEDARRSSATGRKCRCDKAEVLEIWSVDAETMELKDQYAEARSIHDRDFVYRVGESVTPKEPFCEDRYSECASGIHFFINRQEAINY